MRWAVRLTKPVLMLVAFALSMSLYLYVQSSPISKATVSLNVRPINLDKSKYLFDQDGAPIDFDVTGPRDKVDRLVQNPELAKAIANLAGESIPPDRSRKLIERVKLVVQLPPDFEGVTFRQLHPLNATLERPKTRDAKIKVEFESPPSPGAWANYDRDSFEPFPDSIALTGSATSVDAVVPTVVINPKDAELDSGVRVRLSGVPSNLVMSPPVDWVTVRPSRSQRQVYVNVIFSGRVAPGFEVANYFVKGPSGPSAHPSTTWIRGPSGLVAKTAAIDAPVDISGLKGGWTYTVRPTMPRGLELVEPPLQIYVHIVKSRR